MCKWLNAFFLIRVARVFKRFNFTIGRSFRPNNEEIVVVDQLDTQRLLAIFVAGVVFFNFPMLALWDIDATWLGVPVFPAALFMLWFLLITSNAIHLYGAKTFCTM